MINIDIDIDISIFAIARYVLGWRMDCEATAQASFIMMIINMIEVINDHNYQDVQ